MGYDTYYTLDLQPEDLKHLKSTQWTQEELEKLYLYLYEEVVEFPGYLEPFGIIYEDVPESFEQFLDDIGAKYSDTGFLVTFGNGGPSRMSSDVIADIFQEFSKEIPNRLITIDVVVEGDEFYRLYFKNGEMQKSNGRIVYDALSL